MQPEPQPFSHWTHTATGTKYTVMGTAKAFPTGSPAVVFCRFGEETIHYCLATEFQRDFAVAAEEASALETPALPYGLCPLCGLPGIMRERRMNGNDTCEAGHIYPSRLAVKETK